MTALLEKDLRLILLRKSTLVIYLIIGVVFTGEFSSSFSGAYLTMLGTMLALSTLSYDDSDNCMEFLFTLPCTRKQYVIEKYLFVYGFSFVAGLIGIAIIVAASLVKGDPVTAEMFVEVIASELPILVITGGLMIPLQLKFGPEKTRMVLIAVIGMIFIAGYMVSRITGAENFLKKLTETLDAMNPASVAIVGVGVLVVLSVISMMISVKIMDNKEF